MRNLDNENPLFARPQSVAPIGAILPFLLGGMCAFLANEAAPQIPVSDNPLALFCIGLSITASISAPLPKIFSWDWRTKYFGFSTVYLASASLLGVVPWLCLVMYSALPLWSKFVLFFSYAGIVTWWCSRFVLFYREIFSDKALRSVLYVEESDAIYYSQRNDNWLMEKKFKLKQFPPNIVVLVPLGLAFLLIPFVGSVKHLVGLPFPYIFLTIASLPVTMMVLGITARGYLVFYYYPWKIKKETGKDVYVDMVTKTASLKIK